MRLQDLAIVTETPLDTNSALLEKFKAHDKIQHDPKTDLYSYKVKTVYVSLNVSADHSVARVYLPQQSRAIDRDSAANQEGRWHLGQGFEGIMERGTASHRGVGERRGGTGDADCQGWTIANGVLERDQTS